MKILTHDIVILWAGIAGLKAAIAATEASNKIDVALACRFCEDAPCVAACPRDALEQSQETGIIIVDGEKCNGCGWCIEACEFGAITFHTSEKAVITCDLCDGKALCIEFCLRKALGLSTLQATSDRARRSAVKKLFLKSFI